MHVIHVIECGVCVCVCSCACIHSLILSLLEFVPTLQEGGGERSKKQKKDPNAPKQPLSAYMLWLQENRPNIKKKYPGLSLGETGRKAGELWKALDDKSVSSFVVGYLWCR